MPDAAKQFVVLLLLPGDRDSLTGYRGEASLHDWR
jgi:hypothetical protein